MCDAEGVELARYGDPDVATYWRSAAKPFQALPWVRAGVAERFGWGDREVAIMCASHVGSDEHARLVRAMLADLGLTEADLQCDEGELRARHNCSGNHTGFLAGCRLNGWDTATYRAADHPAQRAALAATAEAAGCAVDDMALATDGCGIVVYATPVTALARAFARLPGHRPAGSRRHARPSRADRGRGRARHGDHAGLPRLISKAGAEGVGCASLPDGRGVARQGPGRQRQGHRAGARGAARPVPAASTTCPPSVVPVARPAVRNDHDDAVGEIVAVLP